VFLEANPNTHKGPRTSLGEFRARPASEKRRRYNDNDDDDDDDDNNNNNNNNYNNTYQRQQKTYRMNCNGASSTKPSLSNRDCQGITNGEEMPRIISLQRQQASKQIQIKT
jgi:hypothetical protein